MTPKQFAFECLFRSPQDYLCDSVLSACIFLNSLNPPNNPLRQQLVMVNVICHLGGAIILDVSAKVFLDVINV